MAQIIHEACQYLQQRYENFCLLGVAHKQHSSWTVMMPYGPSSVLSTPVIWVVFSSAEQASCLLWLYRVCTFLIWRSHDLLLSLFSWLVLLGFLGKLGCRPFARSFWMLQGRLLHCVLTHWTLGVFGLLLWITLHTAVGPELFICSIRII